MSFFLPSVRSRQGDQHDVMRASQAPSSAADATCLGALVLASSCSETGVLPGAAALNGWLPSSVTCTRLPLLLFAAADDDEDDDDALFDAVVTGACGVLIGTLRPRATSRRRARSAITLAP